MPINWIHCKHYMIWKIGEEGRCTNSKNKNDKCLNKNCPLKNEEN